MRKSAVATVACISFLAVICLVRTENHYGHWRVILNGYGKCTESLEMSSKYVLTNHYGYGKLYPVRLSWGELVPPGSPEKPSGTSRIWMCKYHASGWLGKDPITGEEWAWGMPVSLKR